MTSELPAASIGDLSTIGDNIIDAAGQTTNIIETANPHVMNTQ